MSNREHRQFLTRAARRKKEPPTWQIDEDTIITLRAVAPLAWLCRILEPWVRDENATVTSDAVAQHTEMFDGIAAFIVETDLPKWEELRDSLTLPELADFRSALIEEYGHRNPTQPSSSPDGSPDPASTAGGASQEGSSTPTTSPPTSP